MGDPTPATDPPETCPRCDEPYPVRRLPGEIGRLTTTGPRVICHYGGWLYFHDEHSRLEEVA